MALKVRISSGTSPPPEIGSRWPGRSRSTVVISLVSRSSGARPQRSRAPLATSMTPMPTTRTTASVSRIGTETVTGAHSSSAVAKPSTTALSPKIRQNRDTGGTPPSATC